MTSIDLTSNAYVNDILAQPTALRDTLAAFSTDALGAVGPIAAQLHAGRYRQIVLTGMGSSFHALAPIHLELLAHGLCAQRLETSELVHHVPSILDEGALVVAVSQSGRSVEIRQLLERSRGHSTVIGITNSADGPLAEHADATLLTHAGEEFSVSCKTYITGLVALSLLGAILTGQDISARLATLRDVPDMAATYLRDWQTHVAAARDALTGVTALYLAGRGPSLAAAGTGGLITKEAARFPTEGMSCAAFRHGPLELVSPEVAVMIFEGDGPTTTLNAALAADVKAAGGRSLLVQRGSAGDWLTLPAAPARLLPMLEILPVEMATLALASARGHTPGVFQHATKVTLVE